MNQRICLGMQGQYRLAYIAFLIVILIFNVCYFFPSLFKSKGEWRSSYARYDSERLIAHAGGEVKGKHYTNSLEALNLSSAAGVHLVELDFEWTQDGHMVLIHDWNAAVTATYGQQPGKRTLAEFKALKSPGSVTPMTVQELFAWLDAHPNIVVITDVKSNVVEALSWIQAHYPAYAERFIPQIYQFHQYEPVRRLGYYRVILTLYRMNKINDGKVFDFCKTHPVWAVTIRDKRVLSGNLTQNLHQLHIPVYAHTVNDPQAIKQFLNRSVFGVYSDRRINLGKY